MNNICPILTIKDIVVFPHVVVPLFVGRIKSIQALDAATKLGRKIILLTQKDLLKEEPTFNDLYKVGVLSNILQMLKLPDGAVKILVEGTERVKVLKCESHEEYFSATYETINPIINENSITTEAYRRTIISQFESYGKLNKRISPETIASIKNIEFSDKLIDIIGAHLSVGLKEKQQLLEEENEAKRYELLTAMLSQELEVITVERRIRNRVKKQMERNQKEYYLNEQMKAIQKELEHNPISDNDNDSISSPIDELKEFEKKANKIEFTKEAKDKFFSELGKLKNMSAMSPEATVIRNYLDWLLNIPWNQKTELNKNLLEAKKNLDQDHYGLDSVKDRILEFLAVQNRVGKIKGSILCLIGPPGVGKTSLAKSIAKATGRNYVRMSLGGIRDESEIRGHRRTYIGSMPGKIVSCMKKAKSTNPLFLLDEIDKIGADWKGDPSSALLEVLDTEQNSTFNDHYIEVDYDLSDVMFITTANSYKMPSPLLDRMEIIRLSGYTELEKFEIAKKHLIKKQMILHGLTDEEFEISDEALLTLIRNYTREAGVRNLEREISGFMRKIVKNLAENPTSEKIIIHTDTLEQYAGIEKYKRMETENINLIGVVTGLAWTEVGGELLTIEAISVPGKGKITLTGKLGDVMQESIQAAISFIKSRATSFGIEHKIFESTDFHIHVPEGATPKDGPSAGVAMVTSVLSSLTGIPIKKDVAMTGEITLRGRVLPIGGLKEKLLAAQRGGIKIVIIPKANAADLTEIPNNITDGLSLMQVSHVDEVIKIAFVSELKIKYDEKTTQLAV